MKSRIVGRAVIHMPHPPTRGEGGTTPQEFLRYLRERLAGCQAGPAKESLRAGAAQG